jgi:hypothetical protein
MYTLSIDNKHRFVCFGCSPNGRYLAYSVAYDNEKKYAIILYDFESSLKTPFKSIERNIPDGDLGLYHHGNFMSLTDNLLLTVWNNKLTMFRLDGMEPVYVFDICESATRIISAMFAKNGEYVLVHYGKSAKLFTVDLDMDVVVVNERPLNLYHDSYEEELSSISISPDGEIITYSAWDDYYHVSSFFTHSVQLDTYRKILTMYINRITFSHDSEYISLMVDSNYGIIKRVCDSEIISASSIPCTTECAYDRSMFISTRDKRIVVIDPFDNTHTETCITGVDHVMSTPDSKIYIHSDDKIMIINGRYTTLDMDLDNNKNMVVDRHAKNKSRIATLIHCMNQDENVSGIVKTFTSWFALRSCQPEPFL